MSMSEKLGATPPVRIGPIKSTIEEIRALVHLAVPIMLIALVNMGMSVRTAVRN